MKKLKFVVLFTVLISLFSVIPAFASDSISDTLDNSSSNVTSTIDSTSSVTTDLNSTDSVTTGSAIVIGDLITKLQKNLTASSNLHGRNAEKVSEAQAFLTKLSDQSSQEYQTLEGKLSQINSQKIQTLSNLLDQLPPQAVQKVSLNIVNSMEKLVGYNKHDNKHKTIKNNFKHKK